jgi:exosortase A
MINNTNTKPIEERTLKPLIGLVLVFLFFSLSNIPVLQTIWENSFDDGTYSHAYLIPIISMYLYYQLSRIGKLTYRDNISILPLTLLCCSATLFFIMVSAQISLGYWAATLAVLLSSVLLIYRANWQVFFPTLFLAFLMPGWGVLTASLQKISINAVSFLMSYTGIPTFVEGNLVTIPAGVFEIADGCSGLRYLIVSLAISSLFSFLYIKNIRNALVFFTVAILGALITNWVRITALILVGEYTNMESDLMTDHNMFGWYLYIPFMFLLFMWGNKLTDYDQLALPATTANIQPAEKTYPALPNVVIFAVVFALSSTALKSLLLTNSTAKTETTVIKPIIKRFTNVEHVLSNSNNTSKIYLKYYFNGALDNGKPTAHDNVYIPQGSHNIKQEVIGNWNYITIVKKNKFALIRYSFDINKQQTAYVGVFKKQRIKAALSGNSETYLHWQYIPCFTDCVAEKNEFNVY